MSDTEQERFYSLAGTVFDRENTIIDGKGVSKGFPTVINLIGDKNGRHEK